MGPLPYRLTPPIARDDYRALRRRAIFDCGKWDPQVGDVPSLADCALLLEPAAWSEMQELAELLAIETLAAEQELAQRPELHRDLGLPRRVRRALQRIERAGLPAGAARVMRFDFHWTTEGWRISEVNSDVPGGFIEAAAVTRLMAGVCGRETGEVTGDPTTAYATAVRDAAGADGMVALVHATAYSDDRQVMVHLARKLEEFGLRTCLIAPDQLRWRNGRAEIETDWERSAADVVLRFFPAEWLPNLSRGCGWESYFAGSQTPLSNPATALLTQSKRFPLVWDRLTTPLETWRSLLPQTHDPRRAPWRQHERQWVLKPALGRVGEDIGMVGVTAEKDQRAIRRSARWRPRNWIAQRRFEIVPTESEGRRFYPCLGVYTIDARVAGVYGRMSRRPIIDQQSQDVAVLIGHQTAPPLTTHHSTTYHQPALNEAIHDTR